MILNSGPANAATLSNVSQVASYKIKSTAKSFAILSSAIYANKVRAILRELGCNALDSHVAAGCAHVPFDLHLPTPLEPWFAIRDYGTGLTHEQVINIYTTYFESTKTDSNDFVGALGLGSKSPFSYTDNFTVTAISQGRKGIYTAYIDEQGVPAIAQMFSGETDEPNGVEVKLAVDNSQDFRRFADEASTVFSRFAVKPVVNVSKFKFAQPDYVQRDIIPGVSQMNSGASVAVMGNIAYPIDLHVSEQLAPLLPLLQCSLEMNFAIGELDFQASREGLSYVPMTVNAIQAKLTELNASLTVLLKEEADKFTNDWSKALWLANKYTSNLWKAAVIEYTVATDFDLFNLKNQYRNLKQFEFTVDELANKYNIAISGFTKYTHDLAAKNHKPAMRYVRSTTGGPVNEKEYFWNFAVSDSVYFANNDTKIGALERGKYHWKVNKKDITTARSEVYIASAADKTKPVLFDKFMQDLKNPPRQCKVSSWSVKPREIVAAASARDVAVLRLDDKHSGYWRNNHEKVWRDAGRADSFNSATTYYYLPMNGYKLETVYGDAESKDLAVSILQCGLRTGVSTVYGVRKTDLAWVKSQKNWVNLEDHIVSLFKTLSADTVAGMALSLYNRLNHSMTISSSLLGKIDRADSPFVVAARTFENVQAMEYNPHQTEVLVRRYAINGAKDPMFEAKKIVDRVTSAFKKYPMIQMVDLSYANEQIIADYINMVDEVQK